MAISGRLLTIFHDLLHSPVGVFNFCALPSTQAGTHFTYVQQAVLKDFWNEPGNHFREISAMQKTTLLSKRSNYETGDYANES